MNVSPVSFGQVIAVAGKPKKMEQLRKEVAYMPNLARVDYTDFYKKTYSDGLIGKAVREDLVVDFYINGDDYHSYNKKEYGWRAMDEVAAQLDVFYNLKTTSMNFVKEKLRGN